MMNSPIVDHREVAEFADDKINLSRDKVKRYRDQVQSLRSKLHRHIATHPGYDLVKMLNAGSVAKGTALSRLNDMDVAVYIKHGAVPQNEAELLGWLKQRLEEAYPTLGPDQFDAKLHCVTVSFRGTGLDVDVVPVLYDGDADDRGCLIAKDTGDRVETSVKLHLDFIRSRRKIYGSEFTELIRIVKWWVDAVKRADPTSEFKFKSFLIELLVAHLVDTGVIDLSRYPDALEEFFGYIVKSQLREPVSFTDFYVSGSVVPQSSIDVVKVYDPVNPSNNVARRYGAVERDRIVEAAQYAFDALTEAHYATTKGQAYECWRDVLGPSFGR